MTDWTRDVGETILGPSTNLYTSKVIDEGMGDAKEHHGSNPSHILGFDYDTLLCGLQHVLCDSSIQHPGSGHPATSRYC